LLTSVLSILFHPGGGPADFLWKVKKLEPPCSVELKGKAKIDIHQWWWPGRVKGACSPRQLASASNEGACSPRQLASAS